MKNREHTMTYQITAVPDPNHSDYRAISGGNVNRAVSGSFEHLARTLSNLPPESVTVQFIFSYTPAMKGIDKQNRLKMFIRATAHRPKYLQSLKLLIEQGSISCYYDLVPVTCGIFHPKLSSAHAIIRKERFLKPLHERILNDRIPEFYYDVARFSANRDNSFHSLDRILDRVTEPVGVSIKVTPTNIAKEIHQHLKYLAQLDSINQSSDFDEIDYLGIDYTDSGKGVSGFREGQLKPYRKRDPLAYEFLSDRRRFHGDLIKPHLAFEMTVLSASESTGLLISSVAAESAFEKGSYEIISHDSLSEVCQVELFLVPFVKRGTPKEQYSQYLGFERMAQITPVDDFLGAFRLPVGSYFSPLCLRKNTDPPELTAQNILMLGYDHQIGRMSDRSDQMVRGLDIEVLKKHFFITGLPGQGKTTAVLSMLVQLNKFGIPFCVIETAKTEYRLLKQLTKHRDRAIRDLAEEMEIYTPGEKEVSELRFNPFGQINEISTDEHIERLLGCFLAAMPVSGPLPALIGESLEVVYDLYERTGKAPVMKDLVSVVKRVLQSKSYSVQTSSDIMSALEVRLGVLARRIIGRIFSCRESVPGIPHLLSVPSVVEFDCLPPEQACLLTLFLLTGIREYLRADKTSSGRLRYVIFIEEAHNIIGRTSEFKASEDVADPKAFATELICRMLAELRALGVGIVVIDQLPSAVAPEVIKNTASKLSFQLVANQDRQELGGTMLFSELELEDIARLRPGQGYFTTEGYHGPRKITTFDLTENLAEHTIPDNGELRAIISKQKWFLEMTNRRVVCELDMLTEEVHNWNKLRKDCSIRLRKILNAYSDCGANKPTDGDSLIQICTEASKIINTVSGAYTRLVRQAQLCSERDIALCPQKTKNYAEKLSTLIEETLLSARDAIIGTADKLIGDCKDS